MAFYSQFYKDKLLGKNLFHALKAKKKTGKIQSKYKTKSQQRKKGLN